MLFTNNSTTADVSLGSISKAISELPKPPPPDPKGTPKILVSNMEQFRKDISAPPLQYPFVYAGISVEVSPVVPPDSICLIVWLREGESEYNKIEIIKRPSQEPAHD